MEKVPCYFSLTLRLDHNEQIKATTPYILGDVGLCFGSRRTEVFLYTKVKKILDILRLPCFVGRPH